MPEPRSLEEWARYIFERAEHRDYTELAECSEFIRLVEMAFRAYAEQEKIHFLGWLEAWCKSLLGMPSHVKPGDPPAGMESLITAVDQQRGALLAVAQAAQAFEQKLAMVQAAIDGAFMMQQLHGFPYQGPHYGEEIKGLREALADPFVQRLLHAAG